MQLMHLKTVYQFLSWQLREPLKLCTSCKKKTELYCTQLFFLLSLHPAETEAKLVVEQSDISLKELSNSSDTVVSEAPINQDKEIALESGYMSTSVCSDTSSKGKTSPEVIFFSFEENYSLYLENCDQCINYSSFGENIVRRKKGKCVKHFFMT